jgi:hypothetical protein
MPKNALWDRIKKWLSSLLIFVLLATQIVDLPTLIPGATAAGSQSPNLVSIIVSESTNSGGLKSRIKRYASDIQANLSNTRVVIVEVSDSAAPHTIAALNEKLYYEGDGNGISKLVGTVLIGKLPVPVVHKGSKSFLSIFPYTDFDDKVFVYDTTSGLYQAADTPILRDTPEIWHGVMQPNTGSADGDTAKLAEFLDKTHDFYSKTGVFAQTSAEPSVIYLDLYHDQNATKPQDFKAYNTYLKYLEDLSYNRYNKYLAKELYDTYQSFQDPLKDVDPAELKAMGLEFPKVDAMDFSSTPDIQTRAAILKSVKQFFEVFNEKYIGDILKAVNNTGRYGDGKNTRVDIAPVLISKRDEFMKRVLRDGNTTVEGLINELVKNGLARDVLVPKTASIVDLSKSTTNLDGTKKPGPTDTDPPLYTNYYYGQNANEIKEAKDCTIVRGSSLKVEANRGFDISTVESDVSTLGANAPLCFAGSKWQTGDFWGGNSALNLKTNDLSSAEIAQLWAATSPADFVGLEGQLSTEFRLIGNRYTDFVRPTFSLKGQSEIKGGSPLKIANPLDCSNENLIADPYTYTIPDDEGRSGLTFYHPASTQGRAFACVMRDSNGVVGHKTTSLKIGPLFAQVYDPAFRPIPCNVYTITLDGSAPKTVGELCKETSSGDGGGGAEYGTIHKYTYKKVPSWIEHTSPNSEEYGAALKGMVTPSLATDKDRYIDFLTPAGTVAKIEYPNFYRLKWSTTETLTADMVRNRIKEVLDAKTKEISELITRESPTKLSGGKLIEYNLLKRADYPLEGVDLYSRLAGAGNALDTIVDTVLWYNEENATSKYAFILEKYLDSDGNSPYPLAGLKKDYEIAYIGGNGDAQNMFVKIDPEAKNPVPTAITDIQTEANSLANLLAGANISSYTESGAEFKCGPPEWVPIWQWLPAVFCWLGTILPPTIGAGSCGNSTLGAKSAADAQFFTSQLGSDGKLDWQADRNTNGILDGYEWVKDGAIELSASPKQVSFLSNTNLTATLTKGGRILAHDSFNEVKFDVKRIILKKGQIPESLSGSTVGQAPIPSDRVVFSRGSSTTGESSNIELLKKYITFTPLEVRAENGEAKYILGSKTKEIDVVLEASVSPLDKNGQPAFDKRSNELIVEIRNSGLRVTPITQTSGEPRADTSYEAGIAKSVTYNFAVTRGAGVNPEIDTTAVKRPITVTIYDDIDSKILAGPTSIATDTYVYNGDLLKQAGSYRFEFLDASGRLGISSLNILPAKPVSVNAIASSSVFVKGQKNTILVRAVDAFGNIARGNILKFNAKISGGGYFVQNSDTKLEKSTVEWVTSFDVSSNSGGQTLTLSIEVDDGSGKKLSTSLSTESVDRAKIALSVADSGQLIAGGAAKKVDLSVLDGNGNALNRFNGIASLDFPKNSGRFSRQFVTIRDGKNLDPIEFTPGTLAVQNATADVTIPGINEIAGNSLTILPAAPMRVALTSSVAVLEARIGNETEIQATLYDRFSNVAYNHPGGTNARFNIPEVYARYGTIGESATFTNGVARTTLKTTKKPGSLYYTVEVTPGLESNTFEVADKSGARLVIKGYSKNVALLETFYLWNAEKLKNTNYSALSTTLLGADYGNITVPNYLGGEILFAPQSRSLAVTTLINSGKLTSNLASITPAGKVTLARGGLARIDVGSSRGRTTLSLYDPFRRESIGQFYLNLGGDTALIACGSSERDTLDDCTASTAESSIFMRGLGKAEVKRGTSLSLTMDWVSVLDITPRGEIRKYPSIELKVDGKETKNLLSLSVTSNGVAIGRIGIKLAGKGIARSLTSEITSSLENNPGKVIYEAMSPRYAASSTYLGNSSYGEQGLTIAQREDAPKWADRDMIGSSSKLGLEQYADKKSIGFGGGNNTLLEFAGQSSVGESSRAAATYSQIVLGDPVARLPELKSNQNYDRTLGKRLADGDGGIIETSIPVDYNKDGQEDILVFYASGKVELLQNFGGTYRSLGYVIYVVDAGPERKWAGNFSGTGYSSIVMVDTKWQLIVIENQEGKFVRMPTRITFPEGTPAKINGSIMQLEIFDMDRDNKLDLVISDDSGELNILYGSVDATGLYFTKKTLDTNIGLKLGSGSLSQGGALRWNGIQEVSAQTNQADYVRESTSAGADETTLSLADQKRLLNSKIYYTQKTTRIASSPTVARAERLSRALGDDPNNPGVPNAALAAEIQANITTIQGLAASGSINTNSLDNTTISDRATYLRSEFGAGEDLTVNRSFVDRNGGTLQAGDRIGVRINILNKGATERVNFQYLDSFDKTIFHSSENTTYTLKKAGIVTGTGALKPLTDGEFDYQFGGFNIRANESVDIEYEVVTNAVRYGKFKVGELERGDNLGDVSMNANAVCGDDEILYRSTDPRPRSYVKTLQSITTLEDPNGSKDGKFTDFNGNKQPDYIDLLSWEGGPNEIRSSLWDPTTQGILVFREAPKNGIIDGKSFQIGRIVLDASKGYIQSNPVSLAGDIPALPSAAMTVPRTDRPNTLYSGDIPAELPPPCGKAEDITGLRIEGFEQGFKMNELANLTGLFKFAAIGTDKATGNACSISITAISNPSSDGKTVTGVGWKLLTKSTFAHYGLAGTQADIVNSAAGIPDNEELRGADTISLSANGGLQGTIDLSGMSSENIDSINSGIDTIVQWLGCGFGGGACLALPINWAPLAPGSAPVVLGTPISPLKVDTGRPVFSALTCRPQTISCGTSVCSIGVPSMYPMSDYNLDGATLVGGANNPAACTGGARNAAGGSLGVNSVSNFFRFFVTPTITGSVGVAACYGGPARAVGNVPPRAVSPVVPGGNCIVAAAPLSGCTDDGSDGNISDLGTPDTNGTINAASCRTSGAGASGRDQYPLLGASEQQAIAQYIRGGGANAAFVSDILKNAAGRGGFRVPSGPLISIEGGGEGSAFNLSIDSAAIKNFDRGAIERITHERVSAFPDFIMDWVNRQLEEVSNKLTSFTLYIIKPDFRGALDDGFTGFSDKLQSSFAAGANNGESVLGSAEAGRTISGVKAAYEFMSRIPLIKFEPTTLNITYPDIGKEDLNKIQKEYEATKAQWQKEISDKKKLYATLGTQEWLNTAIVVDAESLVSGIDANIRVIESYKKFPDQLSKYLTWKERYAKQLLCNVTAIQAMLDGFISNNAQRFKAWVEFGEMLKNILKGWQLIPDLFYKYDAECGVCRNERHDAKQFKFKLISSIIPPLPIIKFPKWPDIILDLHNVRMGLRIAIPEFTFTPTPLVLPTLPKLQLPTLPKVGISLPGIPTLPSLPPLPELPNLPSLPTITLPELPPPPTIPKLFGSIKFTLNILKIVAKVMCLMRSNPFVPEWRAGDQIAQITERQGKLGIDFLNIEFPQFNASFVDAIKVTTFVNFEFQVDFLLEMAKATFEPISNFTANMSNVVSNPAGGIPGNIDLRGVNPGTININVGSPLGLKDGAKSLAHAFVATIQSGQNAANSNASFTDLRDLLELELASLVTPIWSEESALIESMRTELAYRADTEVQELQMQLSSENAEKFWLASRFIESEIAESEAIRAAIESGTRTNSSLRESLEKGAAAQKQLNTLGTSAWEPAILTSSVNGMSTESPLPDFTRANSRLVEAFNALSNAPAIDPALAAEATQLQSRVNRLSGAMTSRSALYAADTTGDFVRALEGVVDNASSSPGGRSDGSAESSAAQNIYRGIYTFDNARQIRLFDYTDDLSSETRAIEINRLGNGAKEFIYVVSGALYLKTRLGNSPLRPSTDSISTLSTRDVLGETIIPTAPNHFREQFAKSGEIQFDFAPANVADSFWALTLSNYIDRYARTRGGESLPQILPRTTTTRIDLIPSTIPELTEDTSRTGLIVKKPFGVYTTGRGEGLITGSEYRILTSGEKIRIGASKSLFTDGGGARLSYRFADVEGASSANQTAGIITLGESRELKFERTIDIEILSWNILLETPNTSTTPRVINLSSLKWYPILVGSRISFDRIGTRLDMVYHNGVRSELNSPSTYVAYSIWARSKRYSVTLNHPNGWEYASLTAVSPKSPTRSEIRLLSPQIQADREGPLLSLTTPLRAPVYLENRVNMRESITDTSGIRELFVDTDLSVDSDGDSKKDNDNDSRSGTGIVRAGSGTLDLIITPQKTLFERRIKLWATDEAGNISSRESKVVIYSPIPNIVSQSGSLITGELNERLDQERVDLVRFRSGKIDPIGNTLQTTGGAFSGTLGTGSGLILRENGAPIASIHEQSGLITLTGSWLSLAVSPANESTPTTLNIVRGGRILYSQALAMSEQGKIESVSSLAEARSRLLSSTGGTLAANGPGGVGVQLSSGYSLVKNTLNAPTLPGGVFVTGTDRKWVFGIARDGNVYLLWTGLSLEYRAQDGVLTLRVVNTARETIADIYYLLSAEFVIK